DFQGNYALYHGNLQIGENHRAAMFLVEKVFSGLKIPLIIAGANPFPALHQTIKQYKHIQLIANPDARKMDKLFHEAGLIVLPAMQRSGIKLKLIDSLMSGKPVLANAAMLAGTGLEMYLPRVETPEEWQNAIRMHFENPAEYRLNQESLKRFENAENI